MVSISTWFINQKNGATTNRAALQGCLRQARFTTVKVRLFGVSVKFIRQLHIGFV